MTQFNDWVSMHVNDVSELSHLRLENARLAERISFLAKQVCDYEETLFKLAYPQKFCVGDCKCYDLSVLKERARLAFERFNPPTAQSRQDRGAK